MQPGSIVTIAPAEQAAGALQPETLRTVVAALERDGFCVLGPGVLPLAALDALVERSDYQAAHFAAAGKGPHLDNGLPRMVPWVQAEILVNPMIEQLAAAILGAGAFLRYWGGNCSLPVSATELRRDQAAELGDSRGLQRLHMDSNYPWSWTSEHEAAAAGVPWPHPPQRLFFNFGLFEMSPVNGSTELWPGTHCDLALAGPKGQRGFSPQLLQERRALAPPVQLVVPRGGLVVRDVRCWHRGMPNRSPTPRHMLGIGYNSATDPVGEAATRESNNGRRDMVFSESARAIFESAWAAAPDYGLERNVAFVDGPVDPWGNKQGEVIGDPYVLLGRERFRLPLAPIPLTMSAASGAVGMGSMSPVRLLPAWAEVVARGLPLRRPMVERQAAHL